MLSGMGRLALGAARRSIAGASVVFLWTAGALAQLPPTGSKPGPTPPEPSEGLPPQPPPPPAAEPPARPPPVTPPAATTPPTPRVAPPPVDPPPRQEPPRRPAFLHTREEMESLGSGGERPLAAQGARSEPDDFLERASPWVDFTLTSFYMEDRAGNFLNLGVQVGGYFFERFRFSGRVVVPLEGVNDDLSHYSSRRAASGSFRGVDARALAMLYGVSAGLVVTNSRTFVFGPSVQLQRTDVEAYGTTLAFGLPFEWTTRRSLRIGFELAIGHSFGGSVHEVCRTFSSPVTSCGSHTADRPSGTSVLFQYNMGWALGSL
jgi:hypothetical protein